MRLSSLKSLEKKKLEKVVINAMPKQITITDYAKEKAFKVNELVKEAFDGSYEWYGFLLAKSKKPHIITDIGFGKNSQNQYAYTKIDPESIDEFRNSLDADIIINGWIHSHGNLGLKHFSGTDDRNQETVLSYVCSLLKKPIEKIEIPIENIEFLIDNQYKKKDLKGGTVTIVSDNEISQARIFETIYGGFSYAVVIGDEGWSHQEIHYTIKSLLTRKSKESIKKNAKIVTLKTDNKLSKKDIKALKKEVKKKFEPPRTTTYVSGGAGFHNCGSRSGYYYQGGYVPGPEDFDDVSGDEGVVVIGPSSYRPKSRQQELKFKTIKGKAKKKKSFVVSSGEKTEIQVPEKKADVEKVPNANSLEKVVELDEEKETKKRFGQSREKNMKEEFIDYLHNKFNKYSKPSIRVVCEYVEECVKNDEGRISPKDSNREMLMNLLDAGWDRRFVIECVYKKHKYILDKEEKLEMNEVEE